MNGKHKRRAFSGSEKVAIVKRHLADGVAVSELCEEHRIQPALFYQWQRQLFENGAVAFERKSKPKGPSVQEQQIARLKSRLVTKHEVIGELTEEEVKAK